MQESELEFNKLIKRKDLIMNEMKNKEMKNKEWEKLVLYNGIWIFLTWLITAIHHYYTGILYHTMWRAEFAAYAVIPMMICIGLLIRYRVCEKRLLIGIYFVISFFFFFLVVGVWEGAWCHLTKLIFYFFHRPFYNAPASWNVPAAPVPDNVFSEVSGVMNFVFASCTLYVNWKLARMLVNPIYKKK